MTAPKLKTNKQLRGDVRDVLASLSIPHLEWLATKCLEQFPETEERLLIRGSSHVDAIEVPDDLDEKTLWPLIVRRQATIALKGTPRDALESATFFAKVFGKIADPKAKQARKLLDERNEPTPEAALRELAQMGELLDHEPGEATIVDSGVQVS